jgi:hypothetical protein
MHHLAEFANTSDIGTAKQRYIRAASWATVVVLEGIESRLGGALRQRLALT